MLWDYTSIFYNLTNTTKHNNFLEMYLATDAINWNKYSECKSDTGYEEEEMQYFWKRYGGICT